MAYKVNEYLLLFQEIHSWELLKRLVKIGHALRYQKKLQFETSEKIL